MYPFISRFSGRAWTDPIRGCRNRWIAAKKLRYAAEFFEPLYESKAETKRHRRFITAMKDLQDQLGSLNDLATAADMLAALELSDVAGAKDLFSAEVKSKFLEDAAEAHDTFVNTRRF
ncbi:CHAD domain-containing protein [Mesorhizobium caraganae]|uniref:CHAD domain-containing protein n=1 Tax=Mesorhizobium caraganae TaxID=483206 RepID=UPI001FEDD8DF|nr:CHAD domain-containing protein [Mesorhizobium caraganae]